MMIHMTFWRHCRAGNLSIPNAHMISAFFQGGKWSYIFLQLVVNVVLFTPSVTEIIDREGSWKILMTLTWCNMWMMNNLGCMILVKIWNTRGGGDFQQSDHRRNHCWWRWLRNCTRVYHQDTCSGWEFELGNYYFNIIHTILISICKSSFKVRVEARTHNWAPVYLIFYLSSAEIEVICYYTK